VIKNALIEFPVSGERSIRLNVAHDEIQCIFRKEAAVKMLLMRKWKPGRSCGWRPDLAKRSTRRKKGDDPVDALLDDQLKHQ
jgi:hypothetical protein